MRGVIMHAPGDVRVEDRDVPTIVDPTEAIIRLAATCICGSDLWAYHGVDDVTQPTPMGHEYAGVVEQVGADVTIIKPGQFAIGSFFASDNTCAICQAGYQTHCFHRQPGASTGGQSELLQVPLADGTLVATPGMPDPNLAPSLLGVLAARQLGTDRVIAMSRTHPGSRWPVSSAPPTSSKSAATTAWPRSRSSPAAAAPTP